MYLMGLGVKINLSKAVYWFEKAANQGFDNSQYELGLMYATGKGVIQNYQNAIFYWQQAATQGNENAKKAL
ncbi:tetratricopeptide repeat protein, partial [Neisseria sp. P0017.S006]|uniref:tetratricopeptide repeat protein n=3 Tax=Neisseria TaxID=482 RepID=UPI003F7FD641